MPSLKYLTEELTKLSIGPSKIRLPVQLYDGLVDQAEDIGEENSTEED